MDVGSILNSSKNSGTDPQLGEVVTAPLTSVVLWSFISAAEYLPHKRQIISIFELQDFYTWRTQSPLGTLANTNNEGGTEAGVCMGKVGKGEIDKFVKEPGNTI